MSFDAQQFYAQGLAALLGGLVGSTLAAWLGGLYRIKGQLTGRAEKLDVILDEVRATARATEITKIATRADEIDKIINEVAQSTRATEGAKIAERLEKLDSILDEVRATAKATELSKIAARADEIDKIVGEVARSTKASEGAKIATRLEKLDEILPEVRAVTETQKRIEAGITGGEWDRQWRLNQMREGYSRLLIALYGLQDFFYVASGFASDPVASDDGDARAAHAAYRKSAADFKSGAAMTRIFAGPRAVHALDEYDRGVQQRVKLPWKMQVHQASQQLVKLHFELVEAAREDMHVVAL